MTVIVNKTLRTRRLKALASQYRIPAGRKVGASTVFDLDSGCSVSLGPEACVVSFVNTNYEFDKIQRAFGIFIRGAFNSMVKTTKSSDLASVLADACTAMPLSLEELQTQIARRGPSFYRAADAYRAMWIDMHSALEIVNKNSNK